MNEGTLVFHKGDERWYSIDSATPDLSNIMLSNGQTAEPWDLLTESEFNDFVATATKELNLINQFRGF